LVYAASSDAYLYAVDAVHGHVRWRFPYCDEPLDPTDFRAPTIAVRAGTVHVGSRSADRPGAVHAVDAGTGAERWRRDLADVSVFDVAADEDALVVGCADHLRCLDADDGTQRWGYARPDLVRSSWDAPILHRGSALCAVFVPASNFELDDVLSVVLAVDVRSGTLRWETAYRAERLRLAAAYDRLYVGTRDGRLMAVDVSSGEPVRAGGETWGARVEARPTRPVAKLVRHPSRSLLPRPAMLAHTPVSAAMSTPVVTAGDIYVACGNGIVAAFPELSGDGLWTTTSPTGRISGLTYADGVLYAAGDPHLAAFDAAGGDGPWRWPRQKVERGPNPDRPPPH
jgi:outer membrane protein assembly factor BamB